MKVLIACEFSGIVRDAFVKMGHDAQSCDLLPTERPNWTIDELTGLRVHHPEHGYHWQCDVKDILDDYWDLLIAHPPCTRLCNSGVRWLAERNLWDEMEIAALFFKALLDCNIPRRAIENPIMHGYATDIIGYKHNQVIQPWQFGHGETKATCLWLRNLPLLKPTNIVSGRDPKIHFASPSPDRWRLRSITYQGIADAMAAQWGNFL